MVNQSQSTADLFYDSSCDESSQNIMPNHYLRLVDIALAKRRNY